MMMIPKWGNYPGDGGGGITLVIDRDKESVLKHYENALSIRWWNPGK